MTLVIKKLYPQIEPPGEPIESDKWKNLFFYRTGKTFLSRRIHSSERIAKRGAERILRHNKHGAGVFGRPNGPKAPRGSLSHAVQVPWKE